ncbi:DsbA family oxidoreductase [Labilibaculum sp. DW002]|uniref:DsbA family oxidoreductase n=1 Tax=Paralabilibaculum antarcticum TaxID=2912572 RepID=A0ABT5VZB5_9BACT|nr:DsbA family oxidoreductase [Labilibaculum sp. DW002]MDE5419654.1 DsbA family oxidoreductase [Labilibaculum sp. DW002]
MNNKIKLDIISDVVCPWCIIGYRRLEQAISEMGIQDQVEIVWQPFELNPDMPQEGEDILDHVKRKYGSSPEDWKRSQSNMANLGEEVEFTFNFFEGKRIVNTREAHILLDYAKEFGKQTELKMRLFESYFSEGKDVSDRQILAEVVLKTGLNVDDAIAKLDQVDAREKTLRQESFWRNADITSVPTIVFNRSSTLNGAQSVDVYKKVLADLLEQKEL